MAADRSVRVELSPEERPDRQTRVEMEAFVGPLAMLLSLIEQRQLDVLTVPLASLAGAYLEAVARLSVDRLANISGFISVAAQLILIKSRALLPRVAPPLAPVEEGFADPEEELRRRLLLYRAYRDAGGALGARLGTSALSVHREPAVAAAAATAGARRPAEPPLDPSILARSLTRALALAPEPAPPPEVMPRTVTLVDQAAIIRAALERAPFFVLQDLLREVRDRVVIAVTFLAMLELAKREELTVTQDEPWGPIVCRARSG